MLPILTHCWEWRQRVVGILEDHSREDIFVAVRHLEDLEIFVGQRSRLHPGPGWAAVLEILRRDLDQMRAELRRRDIDESP